MTDRRRGSSVGLRFAAWIGWMRYLPPLSSVTQMDIHR
jgi:hypothetical protein